MFQAKAELSEAIGSRTKEQKPYTKYVEGVSLYLSEQLLILFMSAIC